MALPNLPSGKNSTPKRVAAHLIDTMVRFGLSGEIDAMEVSQGIKMSLKQREDVIEQHEIFVTRINKMTDKA